MRILVLDDDAFALRLVRVQLEQLGFTDVTAHELPREALAVLETDVSAADVILLDLQMPEIDGIEFLRHLARLRFAGGVILISGEDERVLHTAMTLGKAHKLDLRGALHKPITPEQLRSLLGTPAARTSGGKRAIKTYPADRLRQAILGGELVNFYQPKIEFATGRITGVEALVRWQHPEDGLVFPDAFIGVAEEHDLIDDLTRVVMLSAIAQARQWQDAGLDLHVGVNISMDNLETLDFPDFVAGAVAAAGIPPRTLVLEVTESRLMKNALSALDILTRLRLKHIGLSIDDFGTGHSSLAQLRDIPFDELKIDRGFVHQSKSDASRRAIVEGSLAMARQLGLRTVAEGVEDRDDWDQLRSLGCTLAQGYFISKPLAADALFKFLGQWADQRTRLGLYADAP